MRIVENASKGISLKDSKPYKPGASNDPDAFFIALFKEDWNIIQAETREWVGSTISIKDTIERRQFFRKMKLCFEDYKKVANIVELMFWKKPFTRLSAVEDESAVEDGSANEDAFVGEAQREFLEQLRNGTIKLRWILHLILIKPWFSS